MICRTKELLSRLACARRFAAIATFAAFALPPAAASASGDCDIWVPFTQGFEFSDTAHGPHDVTMFNGDLVVGGQFATTVDGVTVNNIARFDGLSWLPLGGGTNHRIFAMTIFEGDLIATGVFTEAGGQSANYIARWDGGEWHPLAAGLPVFGGTALAVHNGDLYAGTGVVPGANGIFRWDGSSWTSIGSTNSTVRVLHSFDGDLIAGGQFTSIDGVAANFIARWDGKQWHPMGSGTTGTVEALTTFQGNLLASGNFSPSTIVAVQWAGGVWSPVGGPAPLAVSGRDLVTYADDLIAVNRFSVLRLVGLEWEPLIAPLFATSARAATVYETRLIMVGGFNGPEVGNGIRSWENCLAGACCVGGGCVSLMPEECAAIGGVFHGAGSTCAEVACPAPCPADLNASGAVDVQDLLLLLGAWGLCP